MTLPDPADATIEDVHRALRRKFLTCGPSVEAAMSIVGLVLEAKDRRFARLREALGQDMEGSAT